MHKFCACSVKKLQSSLFLLPSSVPLGKFSRTEFALLDNYPPPPPHPTPRIVQNKTEAESVQLGNTNIADMDKCPQDKCCLNKCHGDGWNLS